MPTFAELIQANKKYPCESCTLPDDSGRCTLDEAEYFCCMLGMKKHHSIKSDTKWIRECHFEPKECYEPGHLRMACEMGKAGKVTPGHHCYKDTILKHKKR